MPYSLKLLIAFRKCFIDPISVKHYVEFFFNHFRKNFEDETSEYKIYLSDPISIDVDNVYQADLCEIEVTLEYNSGQSYESLFSKIIQDWCNPELNKLSNLWLRIAEPSFLRNSGKLVHSDVEIKGIAFGTLPDMHHFLQHYHYDSVSDEKEISGTFVHSERKLVIYTCFLHSKNCAKKSSIHNKFQFSYRSISRVIINYKPNTDFVQMFFCLQYTPALYVKKRNKRQTRTENCAVSFLESDQEYQMQTWERTLDFGCSCNYFFSSVTRISRCPVLKITLPKKNKAYNIIERLIHRCSSNTLFYFAGFKTIPTQFQKMKDFHTFPFNEKMLKLIPERRLMDDVKFKCQFAWNVLNSRSLEVKDQISLKYERSPNKNHWERLKKKLRSFFNVKMDPFDPVEFCEMINKMADTLSNTLFDISEMINKSHIFTFEDALTELFKHHLVSANDDEIPEGMCLVRRVILMPSKIMYMRPTEHFDNRVIREFGTEYLLRVSIQDDNFQKLTYAVQNNSKKSGFLMRVMGNILLEGIDIGPRKYEILAASNSQLRGHGLWVYAEDENGCTAEKIREWMGDFSHINNVPKYMARMGQCFTTSDESVQIQLGSDEVIKLEEIEIQSGDREYKFSDGVGMISKDLAKEVRKALAQRSNMDNAVDLYEPTAFQIRFKGCKGMLAESRSLTGRRIGIRPSMEKFQCDSSSSLEIVKISAPRAVFLNQSLITILENLGVKESVFLELQKKMVFDLTDSLVYERKACKMLENSTSLEFPFKKLCSSGVSLTQDPFFRSLLLSVYKSLIRNLKKKARIAISPKYGRNMLGVVDETRTLKYGEIFCQYSEQVGNVIASPTKILKGTVVVTKHPCMHPGDVRKFKAVDVPALHHINDCIVFPAQGKRPHPDEMGGSDLDGDEYAVIWDPKLIFPRDNYSPMDYPPNKAVITDGPIKVEDMIEFLCDYIQNDNIGLMANAYLAWADYNPDGIFSEVCLSIAHKFPQALDFAKSGTTQSLEPGERPKHYPDFMGKGCRNNNYKSDRTLGLLYRMIRNLEASVSNIRSMEFVDPDQRMEYHGWAMFENLAKLRRDQFSKRVKRILAKYGLQSEAEALTGFIDEVSDCNSNKYDSDNLPLLSRKYLFHTMKSYKLKFLKDCEEESVKYPHIPKKDINYRIASAWYMVTYRDHETSILSFPWVISDVLCELRDRNGTKRKNMNLISESTFITLFDKLLLCKLQAASPENKCPCVSFLRKTVLDWLKKSSFILTVSSEDIFCEECLDGIVSHFRQSKMFCCSYSGESACHCSLQSCSPMKMILEFFKYYASEVVPGIGTCQNERLRTDSVCEGFQDSNLQSLALKTYAVIAITQSMQYLENDVDNAASNNDEEGDPIRIQATKEFEDLLVRDVDWVCKILRELSGVKSVQIDGSGDGRSERSHFYMIVQSIGNAFNRWQLEELIMDPKCPSKIRHRLNF